MFCVCTWLDGKWERVSPCPLTYKQAADMATFMNLRLPHSSFVVRPMNAAVTL